MEKLRKIWIITLVIGLVLTIIGWIMAKALAVAPGPQPIEVQAGEIMYLIGLIILGIFIIETIYILVKKFRKNKGVMK